MKTQELKQNSTILPILLVIKVYTAFLMTNSFYSIGILGKLQIFFIWIVYFFLYYKKIKYSVHFLQSFAVVTFYFLIVYLLDMEYSNKAILYDISLVYVFLSLSKECQVKTFRYFVGFGTILLFFSMIEYVLFLTGRGILLGTFDRGENEYSELPVSQGLFNYYIITQKSFFRFQSLFREPGYLGQCAGLVFLYWGRIPLKQSIIWLIAGLMTVSLFFYLFLIISIPVLIYFNSGRFKGSAPKVRNIFFIVLLLSGALLLVPDDVAEVVEQRVEVLADEGTDNRSTASFNMELSKMVENGDILWGLGAESYYRKGFAWGNTGMKGDLYKFGIFGVSLVVLAFAILMMAFKATRSVKFLCVVFFILLYYNGDMKYALYIYIPLINIMHYIGGCRFTISQNFTSNKKLS